MGGNKAGTSRPFPKWLLLCIPGYIFLPPPLYGLAKYVSLTVPVSCCLLLSQKGANVCMSQHKPKRSAPVGVVPAPPSSAAICHLELACSEAVLADFAAEAFIALLCLLICIQMNMPIYILDKSSETQILEVLGLPRFMVAFSLKEIQYLVWEH